MPLGLAQASVELFCKVSEEKDCKHMYRDRLVGHFQGVKAKQHSDACDTRALQAPVLRISGMRVSHLAHTLHTSQEPLIWSRSLSAKVHI